MCHAVKGTLVHSATGWAARTPFMRSIWRSHVGRVLRLHRSRVTRATRKLKTAQSPLGSSLLWMGEVGFGGGLILHGRHFVGIDADDQIADMIVDPCELVADARRDDDRVARFEVVRDAVADRGPI